jgi:hypothetical protein
VSFHSHVARANSRREHGTAAQCDQRAKGQGAEFARVFARGYGLGVERRTRVRVLLDTSPRRLGRFFALAVALHTPLTPLMGFLGLIRFLNTDPDVPSLPPVTEIPLDIIDDEGSPAGNPAEAPEGKPAEAPGESEAALPVAKPKPKPKPKPEPPPDAGVEDAGAPDASKTTDAGAAPDAGAGDAAPTHRPGEGIGSPVAGIGDKRVVDPNANVQLLVHNDRVRRHPLGARVGPLLRDVYQWRDFFGPTSIDPVRDIDRMLIVGPQLRDSSQVVAILQFNVPQERIRAAVDLLVSRDPEGSWSTGAVPVAHAHADRGERAFVFPSPQVLVVTPPSAEASAERLPRKFRLPAPKGDEIVLAKLSTPWRAFSNLHVSIPKSIQSAEVRLSPTADGGFVIDVLAHDETEALASSDARDLTTILTAATSYEIPLLGSVRFIEKGSFEPDRADIRGEIVVTRKQAEQILDFAASYLGGSASRRPRAAPTTAPVPTAAPAP